MPALEEIVMIRGGCFCGSISYEIEGALQNGRSCHCSKCRKAFSGSSSAYAEVASADSFRWTSGEESLSVYSSVQDWGLGFCADCGTTLCGLFEDKVHGVTLGSVDGDPGVEIEMHLFVGSKAPWDHISGTAPQYAEHPPQESGSG
jgi:hypothetical protein